MIKSFCALKTVFSVFLCKNLPFAMGKFPVCLLWKYFSVCNLSYCDLVTNDSSTLILSSRFLSRLLVVFIAYGLRWMKWKERKQQTFHPIESTIKEMKCLKMLFHSSNKHSELLTFVVQGLVWDIIKIFICLSLCYNSYFRLLLRWVCFSFWTISMNFFWLHVRTTCIFV